VFIQLLIGAVAYRAGAGRPRRRAGCGTPSPPWLAAAQAARRNAVGGRRHL